MSEIYIIMGKSATGKDTLYREVMERLDGRAQRIVTYTTRPMRDGEKNGRDYIFSNDNEVTAFKEQGRIIEMRTYDTVYGPWHYFTLDDGQIETDGDKKYVIINTLEAYRHYVEYYGRRMVVPIYIEISEKERIHRAMHREDEQEVGKYTEMCRRFLADEEDFAEEKLAEAGITAADRYDNTELEPCVERIVNRILAGN